MEFVISVAIELHILTTKEECDLACISLNGFETSQKITKRGEYKIVTKLIDITTKEFDFIKKTIVEMIPDYISKIKGNKWLGINLYNDDLVSLYLDNDFIDNMNKLGISILINRY